MISEIAMTQTLERAIAIAATAHAGQVDKGGAPYILHPLKVMLRMSTLEERIVAVLHDVVEDCDISLEDLRQEGFSEVVLTAIESVTKVPGESYEDFVERAAQNPIGRVVKLADLEENSDLSRIASPSWEDLERIEKYRRAIGRLR
jgi:(p)ppGpp synthase/HD superfamily hydrolase